MTNKVQLEGIVTKISPGQTPKTQKVLFITVMQIRKLAGFESRDYFALFANPPISEEVRNHAKENQPLHIEGKLITYRDKEGVYRTSIEIQKIIV